VLGYQEVVQQAWEGEVVPTNPFLRLHIKLQRTGSRLRQWSRAKIGNVRLLLCAAKQLIGILDVVQEFRQLTTQELQLKRDLKARYLGLAAVEKIRAKQQSRLTGIKAADAQSKLFFLQINGRKRKNYIQKLQTKGGQVHSHSDKEQLIYQHFSSHFGVPGPRHFTLDWDRLGLTQHDLSSLEKEFTEDEVHAAILDMASDKAPGPDGYIGAFYKASWEVIKGDLLAAINYFFSQHDQHFQHLNSAHLILIPKKLDALKLSDYRPISLTHSAAKLVSKLLAARLAPHLNVLASRAQSAFIKKRSIHDNFLYTQNLVRDLHRLRKPALFLKLDIAKAFDSVRWDYLMETLSRMGFGPRWRA